MPRHLGSRAVIAHIKVGIRNVALAQTSLSFSRLIPLLHGNTIISFRQVSGHYEVTHAPRVRTQLFPMRRSLRTRIASGFIFKQSTFGAYPVPMENAMLMIRLLHLPTRRKGLLPGVIHLSIISNGVYTPSQIFKQKLFLNSLVREYADNARRVLGVSGCPSHPSVSGLCNNEKNTESGSTLQNLFTPNNHKRPPTKVMRELQPNVRDISEAMMKTSEKKKALFNTNMLFVIYGQFLDHEIVSTPGERIDREASMPIRDRKTGLFMSFTRAGILRYHYKQCCTANYFTGNVWQQPTFNRLTSFIDGGAIYGSNHLRANVLRTFRDGKIVMKRLGKEMYLPFNSPSHLMFTLKNEPRNHDRSLFTTGDTRVNENVFLTAIHTIFAREHNRVCGLLREWYRHHRRKNRKFQTDEWLYQIAKQIVTAEFQSITYNEFLPRLLGKHALPKYRRYNSKVDARISTYHSSFAYRFGHSAIWDTYDILDRKGSLHTVTMKDLFFNTKKFLLFGMDNLFNSMFDTPAAAVDEQVVDSLRNFLFNPKGRHILDLAALNLHRSRDLGIPSYLGVQSVMKSGTGLNNILPEFRDKLLKIYGRADKIDAFIGGLCEQKRPGSLVGPLFWAVNTDQFLRLRDGDRHFYKNMKWHNSIRNMPIVKKILKDEIRISHVIFPNADLVPGQFEEGVSLFSTASRAL